MANSPIEPQYFDSFDGQRLAWRETGEGRPVILIHGFFSDAVTNWVRYGHAAAIAVRGFRVIMPDLRGHGSSARPHDASAYPPDALAKDGHALIAHLGLTDYDLGGYSLGARTTCRMLATGATPRRVVFRIDGRETGRMRGRVSAERQFPILSLIAADYEIPKIREERLPQHMDVDWVRVWETGPEPALSPARRVP